MSLFDDYPNEPLRVRSETCCEGQGGRPLVQQLLHTLAHSRVPFSLPALAALAAVEEAEADRQIGIAIDRREVGVVEPEDYMDAPTGLYIGRLGRRR